MLNANHELPYLQLVSSVSFIENSCLRFVFEVGDDEMTKQYLAGRSSPMAKGNAVALLFEAAMDDHVERPWLMDLAEAMYDEGSSVDGHEEDPYGGGEGDGEEGQRDRSSPSKADLAAYANHYQMFEAEQGPDDDGEEDEDGFFAEEDPDHERRPDSFFQTGRPASQGGGAVEPSPVRRAIGTTTMNSTTMMDDPLLAFWHSQHEAANRSSQEDGPGTRPSTQQPRPMTQAAKKRKPGGTEKGLPRRANTPGALNASTAKKKRALSPIATSTRQSALRSQKAQTLERRKKLPQLATQSLNARKGLELAKQEKSFWLNRLKMLHREVDKAQTRVDLKRDRSTKFQVSSVINETVEAQLAEERKRDLALRQEKADAIRAHKAAHRIAVRQAQSQTVQNKVEAGRLMKVYQRNHLAIVESLKEEEYQEKCARRAEVQQTKVISTLKRLRERAMKQEEIRRNKELRVAHVRQEERACKEEVSQYLDQSSKLVAKIRQLRAVEGHAATTQFALRALDSHMYTTAGSPAGAHGRSKDDSSFLDDSPETTH